MRTILRGHARLRAVAYLSIILSPLMASGQPVANTTTNPPPASDDVVRMDRVVVSGMRKGLEMAIDEKRHADVIVDAISSEDVGKFPDQNIAESLQRINGVQIERSRGEGSRVSIRGLDPKFNSIKFNGRTLTSAATGGRDFNFLLLQPEFIGALEVFKTPSAEMEEGALSATINIRTLRPLDVKNRRIVLNAEEGFDDNSRAWDPRVSAIYSDTFNDGKVGVLVGLGHSKRQAETHQFVGFGFQSYNEAAANLDITHDGLLNDTVRFDHAIYYQAQPTKRDRTNGVVTLQFKPTDALELYVDGLFAKLNERSLSNDNALRFTYILPAVPTAVKSSQIEPINAEKYAVKYDVDNVDYRNNNRDQISNERTISAAAGFKWKGSDNLNVQGEVSHSDSKHLNSALGLEVIGRANAAYDLTADHSGLPIITYQRGFNPYDPTTFEAVGFNGPIKEPNTDKDSDIKLDAQLKGDWGIFKSIEFGAKYSAREHYQGSRFLSVDAQTMARLTNSVYEPNGREGPSFNAARFMDLVKPSSTFLSAVPGHEKVQQSWLSYSPAKLYSVVSEDAILASTPTTSFNTNTFTVKEDVTAAYLKGNFKGRFGDVPFSGNIGVRAARTQQTSDGYAPDFSQIIFSQQGATTIIPNSTLTTVKHTYTNFLPSANVVFNFTKAIDLRLAAARVMSRPDLNLLSTGTTVNANVLNINSNNPNLQPYKADQLDVSLEWYLAKGSLLSVTPFYKKIDSFIEQARTEETHTVKLEQGGTTSLKFSHFLPSNGAGANLKGVEIGYQQQFSFLPSPFDGFGVAANYTYVDSGQITPVSGGAALALTGVSRNNYNVIAYYENKRFSVRLAYNYRDSFLVSQGSYFGDGEQVLPYRQLDGTFNIQLTRNVSLSLQAINITQQYQQRTTLANYGNFSRLIEDNGRRFLASVHMTF